MYEESSILLDPTAELDPVERKPLPRLSELSGKTIGLLDISKARGDRFLDRLEARLAEQNVTVKRYQKPTFARIAPTELKQQIVTECDGVIEALAD